MNQELTDRILRELSNNERLTMRRYKFLKTMPKPLRPIEYAETLQSWEEAIKQFNLNKP